MTSETKTVNLELGYPHADSLAARLLSDALDRRSAAGESLRSIAAKLGYRSAVVVSHMRTGRIPIPIDRAADLARAVGLDPADFVAEVLRQRYPDIDFAGAFQIGPQSGGARDYKTEALLIAELETLLGDSISKLPQEHIAVLREVVSDRHPRRRWLTVAEAGIFDVFRGSRPELTRDGLTPLQISKLRNWISDLT